MAAQVLRLDKHWRTMSRPAMTFAPPQRRLYATLRRVLASLLVCLMLPGSIADASSFVWCFSDSGHFAIEACTGPVCHGDQLDRAKGQFGEQAERARLIEQHHADCVDVKLLPTAALASARSANFVGEILDFDEAVPPHLVPYNSHITALLNSASSSSARSTIDCRRTNPIVLLRRVTVLRI